MPYLTGGRGVVPSHSFGSIELMDTNHMVLSVGLTGDLNINKNWPYIVLYQADQGFSKCGCRPPASESPVSLLSMQIARLWPRHTNLASLRALTLPSMHSGVYRGDSEATWDKGHGIKALGRFRVWQI